MTAAPKMLPTRLDRLLPSDVRRIAAKIEDPAFKNGFAAQVVHYFSSFKTQRAQDFDDVVKVTVQLDAAKFWDVVEPTALLSKASLDPWVMKTIFDTLGIEQRKVVAALKAPAKKPPNAWTWVKPRNAWTWRKPRSVKPGSMVEAYVMVRGKTHEPGDARKIAAAKFGKPWRFKRARVKPPARVKPHIMKK